MINIVLCGDQSRYQFLRELIKDNIEGFDTDTEFLQQRQVFVTNPQFADEKRSADENILCLTSPFIPLYTKLKFLQEGAMIPKENCLTKFMFFDEFPYRKDSRLKELSDGVARNPDAEWEIVLANDASSDMVGDISTLADALEEARASYADNYEVVDYSKGNAARLLIWRSENMTKKARRAMTSKIAASKDAIEELEMMWSGDEKVTDVLSLRTLKTFVEYSMAMNGHNVWEIYLDRAKKHFFNNEIGKNFVADKIRDAVYSMRLPNSFLQNRCEQELWSTVEQSFVDFMHSNDKHIFFYGQTKAEYEVFRKENRISTKFNSSIRLFFYEKLKKDILVSYITKTLKKMELIINGGGQN